MSELPTILFVDDDPKAGELLLRFSEGAAYQCQIFQSPVEALNYFRQNSADLIISDLRMPGMTGMELLAGVRETDTEVPFIIITGYAEVDNAIEALRLGASDFIKKPFDMDELRIQIERTLQHGELVRENRLLRRQLQDERSRYGMVGNSGAIQKIYSIIDKVADVRCSVIIEGESGTGKELVARAIHYQGQYANQPFVVIDCGALTDTLLESELFGHEKGAFTGAVKAKAGLLEEASGGTVFLDEIGNISDAMQVKLLRVIQEQQVMRVGGLKPIDIDVRFIVATNQDLQARVNEGTFRHDLYHRLNVVSVNMPPLRERREDIPLLIQHFVDIFAQRYHRKVEGFEPAAMQQLINFPWPGNIRELQHLVERHVVLAEQPLMQLETVPTRVGQAGGNGIDTDLPDLHELERRYILKVLAHFNDSREKTAATLGINKATLWRKLQSYDKQSKSKAD
ncbi:MAG: sigma-54 dependent transcriptional regulator [Gammaproteobacteria bacterium]|nr:sigma-54 dependent transcriptional regulator [Gammaproteobacteria bacterium]MDH5650349.1 sigma-54 dependent transcriptional regulator [Gammaproteobacteria bacterium]